MKAEVLLNTKCILGEGAWFDSRRNVLLWLDIFGFEIHELDVSTGIDTCHNIPKHVTTIVPSGKGFILGTSEGVAVIDQDFQELTPIISPDYDYSHYRCNDGKCSPDGRFWIGIMELEGKKGMGAYYAVDGKNCELMLDNLDVPNGIVWNSKQDKMYYTDTLSGSVYSVDYEGGKLSNQSIIFTATDGMPDGMAIDENDNLWIALWGSGCVYNIDPRSGKTLDRIETSAPNVSSVAIADGRAYITSAKLGLTKEDLNKNPDSGALFFADVNVKGIEAFRCSF